MPQNSINTISKHKGPAIEYRDKLSKMNIRDAMATDIRDVKSKFGRKYNEAIIEMLDYSYKKGYIKK